MDKYSFFKKGGARPTAGQRLDTKLFYQNSVDIYAHYAEWKDIDKFYFIPLHMEMTYSCGSWVAEMAPDPVWSVIDSLADLTGTGVSKKITFGARNKAKLTAAQLVLVTDRGVDYWVMKASCRPLKAPYPFKITTFFVSLHTFKRLATRKNISHERSGQILL